MANIETMQRPNIMLELGAAQNRVAVAKHLEPGEQNHTDAMVTLTELIGSSPENIQAWLDLQNRA